MGTEYGILRFRRVSDDMGKSPKAVMRMELVSFILSFRSCSDSTFLKCANSFSRSCFNVFIILMRREMLTWFAPC